MMQREQAALSSLALGRPPINGLRLLRLRWRFLAGAGAVGLVLGATYFLLSPKWYQAEIMIVPKQSSMGGLASMGAVLGDLPFDVGGLSSAGSLDAERIAAILRSRSTTDAVIQRFQLITRYEAGNIEKTRKKVWSLCATTVERKPNLVVLTCEDKEPAVARDMAEYFGQVADEGFRRIATSSASEERKFLEQRVAQARKDLDVASKGLRHFQETNKILDLPEQSKAVVSAMASLEGDLISKRIQLSYLSGFASRNESATTQLGKQIRVLRDELQTLEQRRASSAEAETPARGGSAIFPPAMNVPALRYELEALYREQKIRETIFFLLTERYESLKVDEARDLSTFVVFDHAALPTYRVRPRFRVVLVGMVVGLSLGLMFILVPGWWRDLQRRAALERTS